MKTTSGVGLSALAFQRSRTFRSCGPYLLSAKSGGGLGCSFFFSCPEAAGSSSVSTRNADSVIEAKCLRAFTSGSFRILGQLVPHADADGSQIVEAVHGLACGPGQAAQDQHAE